MFNGSRNRHDRHVDAVLQAAIQETFKQLGGVSSNALLWYLGNKGFSVNNGTVNVDVLYSGMQKFLGSGADLVMNMLFENLCKTFGYDADGRLFRGIESPAGKVSAVMFRVEQDGEAGS